MNPELRGNKMLSISTLRYPASLIENALENEVWLWLEGR